MRTHRKLSGGQGCVRKSENALRPPLPLCARTVVPPVQAAQSGGGRGGARGVWLAVALWILWGAGLAHAEPQGGAPLGVWELGASYEAPFEPEILKPMGDLVILAEPGGQIAALRPERGLAAWERQVAVTGGGELSGLWTLNGEGGEAWVVVAGDRLEVFRGDIGSRLWARELGCQGGRCRERVLSVVGGKGQAAAIYLSVQEEGGVFLVRLDPRTGATVWAERTPIREPNRVIANDRVLILEDERAPHRLRFIEPRDGRVLGVWRPPYDAAASEILHLPDGRTLAVNLRPQGALATVTVLRMSGGEITERSLAGGAGLPGRAYLAAAVGGRLVVQVVDPVGGRSQLSQLLLDPPWTVRRQLIESAATPLRVGDSWVFPPSVGGASSWLGVGGEEWKREVPGLKADPQKTDTFAVGHRILLVERPRAGVRELALVTLDGSSGRSHGMGLAEFGEGRVEAAVMVGETADALVLKRGRMIDYVAMVPWGRVLEKLSAARARGVDIRAFVRRYRRFRAWGRALERGLRGVEAGEIQRLRSPSSLLSEQDRGLVRALREAWFSGEDEAVQGVAALIGAMGDAEARQAGVLEAVAPILVDWILAPPQRGWEGASAEAQGQLGAYFLGAVKRQQAEAPAVAVYVALLAGMGRGEAALALAEEARLSDIVAGGAWPGIETELARQALMEILAAVERGEVRTMQEARGRFEALPQEKLGLSEVGGDVRGLVTRALRGEAGAIDTLRLWMQPREGGGTLGPAVCQELCQAVRTFCAQVIQDEPGDGRCLERCVAGQGARFSQAERPTTDAHWYCRGG